MYTYIKQCTVHLNTYNFCQLYVNKAGNKNQQSEAQRKKDGKILTDPQSALEQYQVVLHACY